MRFFESMVVVAVTGGALLAACGNSEDAGGGGDAGADGAAAACSTDTTSDVHHCGDCTTDCTTLPHVDATEVSCEKSQCVTYPACAAGYADCSVAAPGCETALGTTEDCARCGDVCSDGTPVCSAGACSATCAAPFSDTCDGRCVDTQTDVNNCGACGTVCTSDAGDERAVCVAGVCQSGCQGGFHACGGTCVSNASATACRASCTVCPGAAFSQPVCVDDKCALTCATGAHECRGTCVDDHAVATCGASCSACPAFTGSTSTCNGTSCGYTCDSGYADCDGSAANACEVHLTNDTQNCGACGHSCGEGACSAGVCQGFAFETRAELVNVASGWGGFYVADAHDLEVHTAFNSWTGPAGDYTDVAAGGVATIWTTSAGTIGLTYSDPTTGIPIAVPGGYPPTRVALAAQYGAWTDTAGNLYAASNGVAVEEYASPYSSVGTCAFGDVNDYPIYWEIGERVDLSLGRDPPRCRRTHRGAPRCEWCCAGRRRDLRLRGRRDRPRLPGAHPRRGAHPADHAPIGDRVAGRFRQQSVHPQ
jgi:hypothetical protein